MRTTETLIIGGGLSGLHCAYQLQKKSRDFILVEARSRLGGRILSENYSNGSENPSAFDLGPAWYWPGQSLMDNLLQELKLESFMQYTNGDALYEDNITGKERVHGGFTGNAVSFRVQGGIGQLIQALAETIPSEKILTKQSISKLHYENDHITTYTNSSTEDSIQAKRVLMTLPPRLAEQTINYNPDLPDTIKQTFQNTPTWMASHAKAIIVYKIPFWREKNLSGDVFSRIGPLVEIHDASPDNNELYALFGFFSLDAKTRAEEKEDNLRNSIIDQLIRLFGDDASQPEKVFIKDWSQEPFTATVDDYQAPEQHPTYGASNGSNQLWDGKLQFCSTEMSSYDGGLLEGALYAGLSALNISGLL